MGSIRCRSIEFRGNALSFLAAFTLGCLSFFSVGMLLAGMLPNTRATTVVGNVLLQPMVYLSGATIPMSTFSPGMREFTKFIPLTNVVTLLQGMWRGDVWVQYQSEVVILGAILVVSGIAAVKVFRWE